MKVKVPSHIKLCFFFCLPVMLRNHLSVPAVGNRFESAYSRQPIHSICSFWKSHSLSSQYPAMLVELPRVQYLAIFYSCFSSCTVIPAGVIGFFIDIKSFRWHYGPGVDSASNRNEYQEYFLGLKAAGAWGWQTYHHPVPLSRNLGALTSWNPLSHSRPIMGLLYLYLYRDIQTWF